MDKRKPQAGPDPYSRVDYRRLVRWPERMEREGPFLLRVLDQAPDRSLIDLGCGTGEHCRFLAEKGFRGVGVDCSESMLAKAREEPVPSNLRFVLADLREADRVVPERFGAALSLGNTLVHLREVSDLHRAIEAAFRLIFPGGFFLFQILNYERIFQQGIRHLPLNFRREDSGEIIFLRLMELLPDRRVRFCPTTLRYDPGSEDPVRSVRSKRVELRGWTREDLFPVLKACGWSIRAVYGDMREGPFDPEDSPDLVILCQKESG